MNIPFNHTFWLIAFILLSPILPRAQQDGSISAIHQAVPAVDSFYRAFAVSYHSPGLAYAVIYNGKVVHRGTFGYTDLERRTPVTPGSVFRIASMTKSFVAAAILQLRDAGRLQLDDPLVRYIPEFGQAKLSETDAPRITIRHLLTHTAGFPEDNPWGDRQLDMSDETFAQLIRDGFSFSNAPGIRYEYSNTGYALLGEVIRRVSGQRYDAFIKENLFEPLSMVHSYWEYTHVPDSLLAKGYRWANGDWTAQPMLGDGAYGAMGGLMCSLDDFISYVTLFLDAWPAREEADSGPLKRSSLREMQQPWAFNQLTDGNGCPVTSAYGYGLRWTHDCNDVTSVGHSGGLPGFGCNWMILPEYGLGLICFSNVTYAPATAINTKVAREIIGRSGLKPRKVTVSAILKHRQAELRCFLPDWDGAEQSDSFAANFFLDNDIDMLREETRAVFAKAGRVIRIHDIEAENNLRGTFIIQCEHRDIRVYFTLSPEQEPRIQHVSVRLAE